MAGSTALTKARYEKLQRELSRILDAARQRAEQALARALVDAYWQVGERILEQAPEAPARAELIRQLSLDLDIDPGTLQRAVALRRTYPRLPAAPLSWGHYRLLLPLKDRAERRHYEKLAAAGALSVRQLSLAIQAGSYDTAQRSATTARRKPPRIERPTDPGYLYRASLDRIVDADTLILHVDLGFTVFKRQRLRLAGLDAPPVDTPEGQRALAYVEQLLTGDTHLAVKTHQVDIYGRYIAHVFHIDKKLPPGRIFLEGAYLNQQLLDAGHATPL